MMSCWRCQCCQCISMELSIEAQHSVDATLGVADSSPWHCAQSSNIFNFHKLGADLLKHVQSDYSFVWRSKTKSMSHVSLKALNSRLLAGHISNSQTSIQHFAGHWSCADRLTHLLPDGVHLLVVGLLGVTAETLGFGTEVGQRGLVLLDVVAALLLPQRRPPPPAAASFGRGPPAPPRADRTPAPPALRWSGRRRRGREGGGRERGGGRNRERGGGERGREWEREKD